MHYEPQLYSSSQHIKALGSSPNNNFIGIPQLTKDLLEAIIGEATAIDFYSRLAKIAPNQKEQNIILHIIEDEKAHLKNFFGLYMMLTGKRPLFQINKVEFNNYREGLKMAFEDELSDYETYRNHYLLTQDPFIRDVFLRAFTDEIKHATRFNFILAQTSNYDGNTIIKDYGSAPFVVNIDEATKKNNNYRTAIWTGNHLQVTLMSINVGDDIGLEVHPDTDQFLRIEEGQGIVRMGDSRDQLTFEREVRDNYAIMVPAGKWHNVINTGDIPLKIYSIYAPPHHPHGTVHKTRADAMASEEGHY